MTGKNLDKSKRLGTLDFANWYVTKGKNVDTNWASLPSGVSDITIQGIRSEIAMIERSHNDTVASSSGGHGHSGRLRRAVEEPFGTLLSTMSYLSG